ncbi:hypothetical protein MAPG_05323 [Magnaporthiopsis poae ATCC 64411]|uniref:ubiquitinyl hydrolase 1 n=1 Tax=Magnaporthiopsis poae (strain ATCC 64411 / 73-15) TaxID=644358 RepID=A0A0C4DZ35_MAGP6|nr:hypothetical protein MAPG_05323 [Magnaporthiopsis poae ATCC 64411]
MCNSSRHLLWGSVVRSLRASAHVASRGSLDSSALLSELQKVTTTASSDFLIIYVRGQNAAIFIYRGDRKDVIFEIFEASPKSESILAADDVLTWDFPGAAISVPNVRFTDESFLPQLAEFLDTASHAEPTKAFSASAFKAGSSHVEVRDTPGPSLISSMLAALLEANGKRISPPVLRKRVRDDVCFSTGMPWRRLPLWLILRVCVRRFLGIGFGDEKIGRIEYKFFIALVLSNLLDEVAKSSSPDRVSHLKAKLSMRLVKLDTDHNNSEGDGERACFERLFQSLEPLFTRTVQVASTHLVSSVAGVVKSTTKAVPELPRRATEKDVEMNLVHSGVCLRGAVARWRRACLGPRRASARQDFDAKAHLSDFPVPYFTLSSLERKARTLCQDMPSIPDYVVADSRCHSLSKMILDYLSKMGSHYDGFIEQKSAAILTVMELWAQLDYAACVRLPLLMDFHPLFIPSSLDVLYLPKCADMERLRSVQVYLKRRIDRCAGSHLTIFENPQRDCFAHRYFDTGPDSAQLQAIREEIMLHDQVNQKRKEQEWEDKSRSYEQKSKQVQGMTCLFTDGDQLDAFGRPIPARHLPSCRRCHLRGEVNRMRIGIVEDPLPEDETMQKIAVFELGVFSGAGTFTIYRDTTWAIVSQLASKSKDGTISPRCTIRSYGGLSAFASPSPCNIVLASTTKSFLDTHYRIASFPVALEDLLKPNGLRYTYYDKLSKVSPGHSSIVARRPSFAHHCLFPLANTPFSAISQAFPVDKPGPSSYDIVASQASCPHGVNVHEYLALQTLLSGNRRRWISLLAELGSSNLNFSNEATLVLVRFVALQAGPPGQPEGTPRLVHGILREESFGHKLLQQLSQRLTSISTNWREVYVMDTIITLASRLYELTDQCSHTVHLKALHLLGSVRETTLGWMTLLREEIRKEKDADTARRTQRYAVWAALLCRRTFAIHEDQHTTLDTESLGTFVECSITLQNNLPGNVKALPSLLKEAVIADFKLGHRLQPLVLRSIETEPVAFIGALSPFWPPAKDSQPGTLTYQANGPSWVSCDVTIAASEGAEMRVQTISYHISQGLLLVDSVPVGKLPSDHQNDKQLTALLGNQSFLAFPSFLPDMTYLLSVKPEGHEIHVGRLGGALVVRARKNGRVLELIDKNVFGTKMSFDLPGPLIAGCVHWLDLASGILEVRPASLPWHFRSSNWQLEQKTGRCYRILPMPYSLKQQTAAKLGTCPRVLEQRLISPHVPLFHRVARIVEGVEARQQIVVWQAAEKFLNRNLEVELRGVQLRLHVVRKRLYCRQLDSFIDPYQNIGTWHGLCSMLVFKHAQSNVRTVLVPLGDLEVERTDVHVAVRVKGSHSAVCKFVVNEMLGRMECAPESTLILKKAQLHAMTSLVLPDTLTGRTGTEEALTILSSGVAQPWQPLGEPHLTILKSLISLTPKRAYYPDESIRTLKTERWKAYLTPSIQHEDFMPVVNGILARSERLRRSADHSLELREEIKNLQIGNSLHLTSRASLRRRRYNRHLPLRVPDVCPQDKEYISRDRATVTNMAYSNVLEIVSLVRIWPQQMKTARNLAQLLSQCSSIKGFDTPFDSALLTDRIGMDVARHWGSLVVAAKAQAADRSALMFLFAGASFRFDAKMDLIRAVLAFAMYEELRNLPTPAYSEFQWFRIGEIPTLDWLLPLTRSSAHPPPKDAELDQLREFLSAKDRRKIREADAKHKKLTQEECDRVAKILLAQWPCATPSVEGLVDCALVDLDRVLETLRPEWARMFQNLELSNHLILVEGLLQRRQTNKHFGLPSSPSPGQVWAMRAACDELPRLKEDLMRRAFHEFGKTPGQFTSPTRAVFASDRRDQERNQHPRNPHDPDHRGAPRRGTVAVPQIIDELEDIVHGSMQSSSGSLVRKQYAQELLHSIESLRRRDAEEDSSPSFPESPHQRHTQRDTQALADDVRQAFAAICSSFKSPQTWASARRIRWLEHGLLWPAVTPITVLQQIGSINKTTFGPGMKEAIIHYGLAMTSLQRQQRLNILSNRPWGKAAYHQDLRYREEQQNMGHSNWNPADYPDWLLLEIECNLLIRSDQIDVALATISPRTGSNSVLQLNMGRGKTSCIIPMAAALLSNHSLTRVIVPKALLQQTAQLLQSRLGGLLNRELAHVPFSRRSPTSKDSIEAYDFLHRDLMKNSGVMICLPEHVLSFMLSGLQRVLDNRVNEAAVMVKMQAWLKSVSRDILDESDYTLSARTQLIYPSGTRITLDGHPHRWVVAEKVLQLVDLHLHSVAVAFPESIEVVRRSSGGYPIIYFLRRDVEDELTRRLTKDICLGNGGILPDAGLTRTDRHCIKEFISNNKVKESTLAHVRGLCPEKLHVRQTVYLLRGLLVNRILLSCLRKKWNVEYGLHPQRDPVAVPYTAKGVPSEQSEWGHPDCCVLLTCLAFYYNGVTQTQLMQALEHVLKSDDPAAAYDRWTQTTQRFPDSLREWSSINVDDQLQLEAIWKAVRHNVVVIDYFLNNLVFPQHAKQFQVKLQSSGWDLPLFSTSIGAAAGKAQQSRGTNRTLTTGFSGTNDNRTMLPLNIKQQDLASLQHTNAEVLMYLLRPRNRRYEIIQGADGRRLSEDGFLSLLVHFRIRILIDAGAQILEMNNEAVARRWLELTEDATAALYFDESNKPFMVSRMGTKTPFLASAYVDDLSQCLVYLDEAHTRGTDLKLPPMAKGALTLGLGQSKDKTVQAAMRLRQLGETQAVIWFAPPEVHSSILDLQKKPAGSSSSTLDSSDVIRWLLSNTCDGLEQLQPLYYAQGIDFSRRVQAAVDNPRFLTDQRQRERFVSCIRQDESQTLQALYEPKVKHKLATGLKGASEPAIASFVAQLNSQRAAFRDTGHAVHASVLHEQEREVAVELAYEVESVRQVKKPQRLSPLTFPGLHHELELFAQTGRLAQPSISCRRALAFVSETRVGRICGVSRKAGRLLISTEFQRTVKQQRHDGYQSDDCLRPVNWILWCQSTETAIVIIPEEAELLLPIVRAAASPTWILTYAAPVARKMLYFNRLDYYAIPDLPNDWKAPAWLTAELGVFAGRLYFEWDEYPVLCQLIGLDPSSNPQEHWEDDGDVDEEKGAIATQVDDDGTMAADFDLDQERNRGDTLWWNRSAAAAIATKPLVFLQDWLALRRRGQDFVHTPMGHVTQSKPLHAEHIFFRKDDDQAAAEARKPSYAPIAGRPARVTESTEEEAEFDGIDEMEYAAEQDDAGSDGDGDEEIEYHQDEMFPASDQEEAEGGANPSPTNSTGSADARRAQADSRASRDRDGGGRRLR